MTRIGLLKKGLDEGSLHNFDGGTLLSSNKVWVSSREQASFPRHHAYIHIRTTFQVISVLDKGINSDSPFLSNQTAKPIVARKGSNISAAEEKALAFFEIGLKLEQVCITDLTNLTGQKRGYNIADLFSFINNQAVEKITSDPLLYSWSLPASGYNN